MDPSTPMEPCRLVTSPEALNPTSPNDDREGSDEPENHHEEIDVDSESRRLQKHFEKKMDTVAGKRSHGKVAVLLISWEYEGEDYIDARHEVRLFKSVCFV